MIYLTYNDLPSGIYYGQVIDVCLFIKKKLNTDIRLVALISIRSYWKHRKQIKAHLSDAIVIPMFPKHRNWKLNTILLKILLLKIGKQKVICRGVFATNMALELKKKNLVSKVVFDARGAYKAEFDEYLSKIVHINDSVETLENKATIDSDYRLAVSKKLVDYWKQKYEYEGKDYVIIPCTLNSTINQLLPEENISSIKQKLNYNPTDIIMIYSGSNADWQSINTIDEFLLRHLNACINLKVILLSKFVLDNLKSYQQFPERITQKWISPDEVHVYLSIADFGLLIRERSITNEVASPTKFSEYLNAGLKVIISPSVGDISDFVLKHNSGFIYDGNYNIDIETVDYKEKQRMNALALIHFTKENYKSEYQKTIS